MEQLSRGQAEIAIRERLVSDPGFADALERDPHGALEGLFGQAIPEGVTVHVHRESANEIHVVLPPAEELSEQELEMVSGGVCWSNCPDDMGP